MEILFSTPSYPYLKNLANITELDSILKVYSIQ